ncbi:MAG: DUF5691 domain-containing protein, partial [Bacteroidota bacterium]
DSGLGEVLKMDTDSETLLAQMGGMQLAERAGYQPLGNKGLVLIQASPELHPYLPSRVEALLPTIMRRMPVSVLTEFLETCITAQAIVPPEYLPELFECSIKGKVPPENVLQAGGKRANWLAALSPLWKYHFLPIQASDWDALADSAKVAAFGNALRSFPVQAMTWFTQKYESLQREELVRCLEAGAYAFEKADESVLEQLTRHRNKTVARAAFDRWAEIEDSRLVARMKEYLVLYTELSLSKGLIVTGLPTITAEMKKDGLAHASYASFGLGKKAGYLCHMLSHVPPATWEQPSLTPTRLIQLASKTEWRDVLLLGWTLAAIRFKQADWATALLTHVYAKPETWLVIKPPQRQALWQLVPDDRKEALMLPVLKSTRQLTAPFVGTHMLLDVPGILPPSVSRLWLQQLARVLKQDLPPMHFHLIRDELHRMGTKLSFVEHEASMKWFNELPFPAWYRKPVQMMLRVLDLRYQFYHLLESS